jgi:hypothetical protein
MRIRQRIGWQGKQSSICGLICLVSILVHRSYAPLTTAQSGHGPAVSRVVAEDAHQPLPFQHRVQQVTVQEWDGVDVGQPWVRLDVEVGLSG